MELSFQPSVTVVKYSHAVETSNGQSSSGTVILLENADAMRRGTLIAFSLNDSSL